MSLRTKLLLLWVGLAVAPLLAIGVFEYFHSVRTLRTLIASQVGAITDRAAEEVVDRHARRVSDLLLIAENAETQRLYEAYLGRDSGDLEEARVAAETFLDQAWELFGHRYHWIELRDSGDAPVLRLGGEGNPSDRDARTSRAGANEATVIVQPVQEPGTNLEIGTVVAMVSLQGLLPREVLEMTFGRAGYSTVIDRAAGRVVYHPYRAFQGEPLSALFAAWGLDGEPEILDQERGTFVFEESDSTRVASFVSLSSPPWTVISSGALQEFTPAVAGMRVVTLFLVLLVAMVASAAFILVVRRGTRSLIALTSAADDVGAGNFVPQLPAEGEDEVGRLSAAFGLMVGRVEEMLRQMETGRHMAVVGEFASQISHEIRNPLTSLKLNLQTLRRAAASGRIPEDQVQAVDTCLQEIHRLDRVVKGVLTLGRPRTSDHVPCSVHAALAAALEVVRPQAGERRVLLEGDFTATRHQVSGDAERLEAAFLNLLLNGLDAVGDGGRIRVTTDNPSLDRGAGCMISVRIADDGPGVPPEARDRVFRPFFSSKSEGSGFGLPLALRTVEEHRGRLSLDEDRCPLGGATFIVELPLLPEESGE
ncbi:MAG: ATP-binding protein [Gemmatimonadota bacterium]